MVFGMIFLNVINIRHLNFGHIFVIIMNILYVAIFDVVVDDNIVGTIVHSLL